MDFISMLISAQAETNRMLNVFNNDLPLQVSRDMQCPNFLSTFTKRLTFAIPHKNSKQGAEQLTSNKENVVETKPPIFYQRDLLFYNMNHRLRGFHLIFSNNEFDPDLSLTKRTGTESDVKALEMAYQHLGFKNKTFWNTTKAEMEQFLQDYSEMDHSDNDCIALTILTHGSKDELYARDGAFSTDILRLPFAADKCPSLAGKPKLFNIQSCRGHKLDQGIQLLADGASENSMSMADAPLFRIPTHSDFVWGYASFSEYVSWRDVKHGSFYIQALCDVILESKTSDDYVSMLSKATQKTITMLNSADRYAMQCPNYSSTLRGKVLFPLRQTVLKTIGRTFRPVWRKKSVAEKKERRTNYLTF
jgi:caspase 7